MNVLRILFELFVIYIIYKVVVDFIIPIYRSTRQMKNTMNKVQEHMRQQQQQQQAQQQPPKMDIPGKTQVKGDDYIDYEEIK